MNKDSIKHLSDVNVISANFILNKNISNNDKMVYITVHSGKTINEGECFFSNEFLSEILNMTINEVELSIENLTREGYIYLKNTELGRSIYFKKSY